jgi:hypothetical protein
MRVRGHSCRDMDGEAADIVVLSTFDLAAVDSCAYVDA